MKLDGISAELEARIAACGTAQEVADLFDAEGIELSDSQLEKLAGGGGLAGGGLAGGGARGYLCGPPAQ